MSFIRDDDGHLAAVVSAAVMLLLVGFALASQPAAARQPESYTLSMGQLTAADHELDAGGTGYFAIGVSDKHGTVVMAPAGSSPWLRLRELRGRTVTLVIRAE